MRLVRGQKMDDIREAAFRSVHKVTGGPQHGDRFKLGADYFINALDLALHFIKLIVSEADLVFRFAGGPSMERTFGVRSLAGHQHGAARLCFNRLPDQGLAERLFGRIFRSTLHY
jgi:hypothetical protein